MVELYLISLVMGYLISKYYNRFEITDQEWLDLGSPQLHNKD